MILLDTTDEDAICISNYIQVVRTTYKISSFAMICCHICLCKNWSNTFANQYLNDLVICYIQAMYGYWSIATLLLPPFHFLL